MECESAKVFIDKATTSAGRTRRVYRSRAPSRDTTGVSPTSSPFGGLAQVGVNPSNCGAELLMFNASNFLPILTSLTSAELLPQNHIPSPTKPYEHFIKMGGNSREGNHGNKKSNDLQTNQHFHPPGGKAKPLKAPRKEKKEMDEDEIAFREKQRAGA